MSLFSRLHPHKIHFLVKYLQFTQLNAISLNLTIQYMTVYTRVIINLTPPLKAKSHTWFISGHCPLLLMDHLQHSCHTGITPYKSCSDHFPLCSAISSDSAFMRRMVTGNDGGGTWGHKHQHKCTQRFCQHAPQICVPRCYCQHAGLALSPEASQGEHLLQMIWAVACTAGWNEKSRSQTNKSFAHRLPYLQVFAPWVEDFLKVDRSAGSGAALLPWCITEHPNVKGKLPVGSLALAHKLMMHSFIVEYMEKKL